MLVIDDLLECRLRDIFFRSEHNRVEMSFISPWDGKNLFLTLNEVFEFQMSEVFLENIADQLFVFNPIEADLSNESYINYLSGCLSLTQVTNEALLKRNLSMIKEKSLVLLHLTAVIGATATCLAKGYTLSSLDT